MKHDIMWFKTVFKAKTHNKLKYGIFPNLREEASFSCAKTQDIVVTELTTYNIYGKIEKTGNLNNFGCIMRINVECRKYLWESSGTE